MANIKSSEIDIRKNRKRRLYNIQRKTLLRTLLKKLVKSISEGNKQQAEQDFRIFTKALDTASGKGLIKKNAASRKKSRMAHHINKLEMKSAINETVKAEATTDDQIKDLTENKVESENAVEPEPQMA